MRQRRRALCLPTPPALAAICRQNLPIVEVGAGGGLWVRAMRSAGTACVGYDQLPSGEGVLLGDHIAAASRHPEHAMLAVWPPDGAAVQEWIAAAPYPVIILVASFARLWLAGALNEYELVEAHALPPGPKGRSELRVYRRRG